MADDDCSATQIRTKQGVIKKVETCKYLGEKQGMAESLI